MTHEQDDSKYHPLEFLLPVEVKEYHVHSARPGNITECNFLLPGVEKSSPVLYLFIPDFSHLS